MAVCSHSVSSASYGAPHNVVLGCKWPRQTRYCLYCGTDGISLDIAQVEAMGVQYGTVVHSIFLTTREPRAATCLLSYHIYHSHLALAERIASVVFALVVLMHSARAFLPSMERSSRSSLCFSALRMRATLLLCSSRETRILVFGFCSEGRLQRGRGRWF